MGSVLPYGGFIRLFLKSHVYSLSIAVILLVRYLKNNKRSDIVLSIVNLIPPFLAFTRSFWLAFILVIGLIFILDNRFGRMSKKKIKAVVAITILFLCFINIPIIKDRISSSFDVDEAGNTVRLEQYDYTREYLKKNILFGFGAGGEYFGETYAIESTFHDALARYGVVGFGILFVLITYPMFSFIRKHQRYNKDHSLGDYLFYGYFIVALVSITNPFLLSSLGMLYLGFLYGIMLTPQYYS